MRYLYGEGNNGNSHIEETQLTRHDCLVCGVDSRLSYNTEEFSYLLCELCWNDLFFSKYDYDSIRIARDRWTRPHLRYALTRRDRKKRCIPLVDLDCLSRASSAYVNVLLTRLEGAEKNFILFMKGRTITKIHVVSPFYYELMMKIHKYMPQTLYKLANNDRLMPMVRGTDAEYHIPHFYIGSAGATELEWNVRLEDFPIL